jgi:hypothetical protein
MNISPITITGLSEWIKLEGKTIRHDKVCIKDMRWNCDKTGPIIYAKDVFIFACDKNFVWHHVSKKNFPLTENLYLFSHPCDTPMLFRFSETVQDSSGITELKSIITTYICNDVTGIIINYVNLMINQRIHLEEEFVRYRDRMTKYNINSHLKSHIIIIKSINLPNWAIDIFNNQPGYTWFGIN